MRYELEGHCRESSHWFRSDWLLARRISPVAAKMAIWTAQGSCTSPRLSNLVQEWVQEEDR